MNAPFDAVLSARPAGNSLGAPTFSLGVRCSTDEITEIAYLEPCDEVKPVTPLAMEAVRQWRYEPTLLNGKPVEVMTEIQVNFVLAN